MNTTITCKITIYSLRNAMQYFPYAEEVIPPLLCSFASKDLATLYDELMEIPYLYHTDSVKEVDENVYFDSIAIAAQILHSELYVHYNSVLNKYLKHYDVVQAKMLTMNNSEVLITMVRK